MANIDRSLTRGHRAWLVGLVLLVLTLTLAACGGAKESPLSQQAPSRRGGVDVLTQVQQITAKVLGVPEASVTESADLRADLGADATQMEALAAALEEAFGIDLSPEEIDSLTTVGSVVDLVKSK